LGTWVGLESLASAFISPVVAYLSQDVFGFVPNSKAVADMSHAERATNAAALSQALLYTMIIPWLPCFFVCTIVNFLLTISLSVILGALL
jgi:hypothetical protein